MKLDPSQGEGHGTPLGSAYDGFKLSPGVFGDFTVRRSTTSKMQIH